MNVEDNERAMCVENLIKNNGNKENEETLTLNKGNVAESGKDIRMSKRLNPAIEDNCLKRVSVSNHN